MGEEVIRVEELSKLYRLGTIGTGSLRQDLQRWWSTSVLKKENPFFKLESEEAIAANKQFLWALKDINFSVNKGEALGIIGSNGSGKSTLLKIISRIVKPTSGTVHGNGKVSSLLEVGTGFHQELTGRENIYISGYILGMRRDEIKAKFDEIVAFSGIEKFIDTPVKRYSSGMYVRLAFAVAAHLEPDILIVDEVLAVGDADFQKKCLGKMREVSQADGRTILFVSHSMQAINNLCDRAIWLQRGKLMENGDVATVVNKYIAGVQKYRLKQSWESPAQAPGNEKVRFKSVELVPHLENPGDILDIRVPLTVKFQLWNMSDDVLLSTSLVLFSYTGECIFDLPSAAKLFDKGLIEGEVTIPGNFLNDGSYFITLVASRDNSIPLFEFEECLAFDLEDYRGDIKWFGKWWGAVRPQLPFRLTQKSDLVLH
ncbi:ABC transporter ATP-binding protein [Pontibacter akesuensis]|uniref:Lipopolysaccharide transport system ATP-binding protein n=1 Tax=Pontibacter akesuensis TaxID=388950 RepID=A0A1I7GIF4_9BACT|nr:polysaccharide ABC transporter ATP-binding protein [Pontibacter akesuensis]GHA56636.1 ABC transporter ATP-binding protein [Pontibacter akesuensis]SFU48223.1 lipopolysaccharide transport system ATP-binding protein [Pontibacter akesuensis]